MVDQNYSYCYFQPKNLIPFYYCFLEDTSPRIRAIASKTLIEFGPQAEIIFI